MRRRALLATVTGPSAAFAGCLDFPAGTPTETPPIESEVELAPCPDRPSELTGETVEPFVEQFERAYVGRRVLARVERVASFEFLSLGVESVTETDGGYRATVAGFYGYAYYDDATAVDDTHGDSGRYTATYLVTERDVFRVEDGGDGDREVNSRTDGERVRCPPEG